MGQQLGSLIGAVGGMVFVLVNASVFGDPGALVVRAVGVIIFAVTIWYAVIRRRSAPDGNRPSAQAFRTYWLCVIGEIVAIPVGAQLLIRVLDQPQLVLPWVVAVVGVHFLPFARAFGVPLFAALGLALIIVALLGAVVTSTLDARGAAGAGVLAGFVLLLFAFWGATPRAVAARTA